MRGDLLVEDPLERRVGAERELVLEEARQREHALAHGATASGGPGLREQRRRDEGARAKKWMMMFFARSSDMRASAATT